MHLDLASLIQSVGYLIVGLIVIASILPFLHHVLVDAEIRASIIKKFKRQ